MGLWCVPLALLLTLVITTASQAKADLSGTWIFKNADRFTGTMVLHQSGPNVNGVWHTVQGKKEPDSTVAGSVNGNTVSLIRFLGNQQQQYILTLSGDGNHVDGYGDGAGIKHGNLNLERAATLADDSALKATAVHMQGQRAQSTGESTSHGDIRSLFVIAIFPIGMVAIALLNEFIRSSMSRWNLLAVKYPGGSVDGDCKPVWWMSTMQWNGNRMTSTEIGKAKVFVPIKVGIPPVWLGATSEGVVLKRNFWNFLHPPLLIPWDKLTNVEEISIADMGNRNVAQVPGLAGRPPMFSESNPLIKLGSMISGTLCEIKVADPELTIYTQMEAAETVRRVMGARFKSKSRA